MRIVHLIDYFQPMLGYQETYLAREQLRAGHEVTVVTSDRYAPFPSYESTVGPVLGERIRSVGRGKEEGIPVWRLPVLYEGGFRCWLRNLRSALLWLEPDVVHAHNVVKLTTLQAVFLQQEIGYRLVVDDHMHRVNVYLGVGGRAFYALFRALVARLYSRRVHAIAAITSETAKIVRDVYGLRTPKAQVIELGVDTDLFKPDARARSRARQELGVSSSEFLVIYTGKVIPAKAPHWLIEALTRCSSDVSVLLLGNAEPSYQKHLESIVRNNGLEDRVYYREAVRQMELPRYYTAADAGCWPREASMAMLEAAACALPIVVVSDGLEARVRYGNGLLYREGNLDDLARCLVYLSEDRDRAKGIGARGRKLAEEAYSWKRINEQFMVLYEQQ